MAATYPNSYNVIIIPSKAWKKPGISSYENSGHPENIVS